MIGTIATLAARDLAARRALGEAAPTAAQVATLAARDTYPDAYDHHTLVASTEHGTGRYCTFEGCIIPNATLETYNIGPFHHGCEGPAADAMATTVHEGDKYL